MNKPIKNNLPLELKYCSMEIHRKEQNLSPLLNEVRNDTINKFQQWLDEWLPSEEELVKFFCEYHYCSDRNDNQYPKCTVAFKNNCPQITKPAEKLYNRLKGGRTDV